MEFIQITDREDFRAEEIFAAYNAAFPEDEKRTEAQFQALFSHPNVKVFCVLHELQFVGYVIGWQLSHFVFLEHFEVFPEFRNQNFGTAILSQLFENHGKIILEAEPAALNRNAARRIEFYRRNNFSVVDEHYIQPAYSKEKSAVEMWLLANFVPENLAVVKEEIFDIVYRY